MTSRNLEEAIKLFIPDSNTIHSIVNGSADEMIPLPDGGEAPTVRKAFADSLLFKDPIPWNNGSAETEPLQLRTFTDGLIYWAPTAQLTNPITMGASPIGDNNWKISPISRDMRSLAGIIERTTLSLDFVNNEHKVYEVFGLESKPLTDILTTQRATAGTYQTPFELKTSAPNTARVNYLTGLLAEKPSTNVAINKPSGGLASTLNASGSSQVSDSDVIKPRGHEGDAVLITGASSLANIVRTPFYPLPNHTSDSTASVYVRAAQGQAQFKLRLAGSSGVNSQNFSVGEKWERFDVSLAGVNQTLIGRSLGILDATAPLYVCSIQIEVGSQVASYIPTTTTAVVRGEDVYPLTLNESNFNQDEGTLYWEGELTTQTGGDILLGTNSRTAGQVFGIYREDANVRVSFNDVFGPPNRLILPITGNKVKIAASYDRITKEYSACVNGGDVLSDVATNIPLPAMLVTKCGWGALAPSILNVSKIIYLPAKLTGEEMKELTK